MQNQVIVTTDLLHQIMKDGNGNTLKRAMILIEKPLLEMTLIQCHGNQSKAAAILGINRSTLTRKLRQIGLQKRKV